MASITPYVLVGDDARRRAVKNGGGSARHELPTAKEVLLSAGPRAMFVLEIGLRERSELRKLPCFRHDSALREAVERGYLEVDVSHLTQLDPLTPVLLFHETTFTPEEADMVYKS